MPSLDFLDYAFKIHKARLQNNSKDKFKIEEYLFDLENTWSINTELFENMIYDYLPYSMEQRKFIKTYIEKIKDLFKKKKKLREDKTKLRGKLLMDKQIMEEFRRRNEENNAYYQEQVEEHKENLEKKESFIKQFEKKFFEVEIYVQREAKNDKEKWDHFLTFEMLAFINNNEMLNRKKFEILDEIRAIRDDMNEILKENVELKKRDEYIDMSEEYDNQKSKYTSLIKLYQTKIKFLERNKNHLNTVLSSLNSQMAENMALRNVNTLQNQQVKHKFSTKTFDISSPLEPVDQNLFKVMNKTGLGLHHKRSPIDEEPEEEEQNKSQINIFSEAKKDQKDHSMLDHSMLKNEFQNMHKLGEKQEHLWDISCIENQEI